MLVKEFLFRAKGRFIQKRALDFFADLTRRDQWSRDQLDEFNWQRRQALVRHCAANVAFYQNQFKEAGFEPGDLKSRDDWKKLPLLTKDDVRAHQDDLISRTHKDVRLPSSTTGGSTGEPLKVFSDPDVPVSAISWRMLQWWGVGPWDNAGYAYRAIPRGKRKRRIDIALWPTRRVYLSAIEMDEPKTREFVEKLRRIRARYLVGYVGALEGISDYLSKTGITIPSLEAVWSTAAPMPESLRAKMRSTFRCPIYSQYGSCEFYFLAAECERQNGLHVSSDIRHIDILPDNPTDPGSVGEIIATDLTNYAFPLLRYRHGDRSRVLAGPCSCGRPYPRIDYVLGRVSDRIVLQDGTKLPGEFWTTIFDDYPDVIKAFQVHQQADYSILIRYERTSPTVASPIDAVRAAIDSATRGRAELRFAEEPVRADDNGKLRFVVSDVKAD